MVEFASRKFVLNMIWENKLVHSKTSIKFFFQIVNIRESIITNLVELDFSFGSGEE